MLRSSRRWVFLLWLMSLMRALSVLLQRRLTANDDVWIDVITAGIGTSIDVDTVFKARILRGTQTDDCALGQI